MFADQVNMGEVRSGPVKRAKHLKRQSLHSITGPDLSLMTGVACDLSFFNSMMMPCTSRVVPVVCCCLDAGFLSGRAVRTGE